jgi:hypothetical protein
MKQQRRKNEETKTEIKAKKDRIKARNKDRNRSVYFLFEHNPKNVYFLFSRIDKKAK